MTKELRKMNQRSISINQSVSNVSLSIGSSGSVASAQEKIAPSYALESTSLIPGDESDLKDRIVYLEQSLTEAKDKFYQMGYNEGKNDGINEAKTGPTATHDVILLFSNRSSRKVLYEVGAL